MTDPTLRQVTRDVDDALEKAVSHELLGRGGFWHRLFRGNALPSRGRRLLVWTGHMIRPRPGIWLLVGGAFSRRSHVAIVDHLITDPDSGQRRWSSKHASRVRTVSVRYAPGQPIIGPVTDMAAYIFQMRIRACRSYDFL
jgi:hypothetical protein